MRLAQRLRRWKRAYPNGEREPFFLSLPLYATAVTALGLLLGLQWYIAFGAHKSYLELTSVMLVTAYIWAGCGMLVWEMVQLFPLERRTLVRDCAAFLLAGMLLLALQQGRFYLLGGYGSPVFREPYGESVRDFLASQGIFYLMMYFALVLVLRGWYAHTRMQRLQVRAAQLQQEAARSELQALRAQLHPHFFFNALNTISALMHDQPRQADRMLELLSRLMRRSLELGDQEMTSLADELAAAGEYLQLQQMRFGARLAYEIEADRDLAPATVPAQILQPIVENCVVHGVEASAKPVAIHLHAERTAHALVVTVSNSVNGPSPHQGFGRGLTSVQRRLQLLYGETAELAATRQGDRYCVRLVLPATTHASSRPAAGAP